MSADELDILLSSMTQPSGRPANPRASVRGVPSAAVTQHLDAALEDLRSGFKSSPSSSSTRPPLLTAYPSFASDSNESKRLDLIIDNINCLIPPQSVDRSPFISTVPSAPSAVSAGDKCDYCGSVISGTMLIVGTSRFHKDHFNCTSCHRSIGTDPYYTHNGRLVCQNCYPADTCASCRAPILSGERVRAMNTQFHMACFRCQSCAKPLDDYFDQNSKPYCPDCYHNNFGKRCAACSQPLGDKKSLNAVGKDWHTSCFRCSNCRQEIGSSNFYNSGGQQRCANCGPARV